MLACIRQDFQLSMLTTYVPCPTQERVDWFTIAPQLYYHVMYFDKISTSRSPTVTQACVPVIPWLVGMLLSRVARGSWTPPPGDLRCTSASTCWRNPQNPPRSLNPLAAGAAVGGAAGALARMAEPGADRMWQGQSRGWCPKAWAQSPE
eukprot:CAMPEP_0202923230 /NCGR_PEP_ID=MMETSP1392-20130828/78344_1 /ASSEMBLY_ACC=CAM_ASM_000868 /TAXON_ID=225041 /ORGANISM="Chlamydomonas chlamydogama, Strain SAG 11-48b" /LENGTH=148 /DNA_ID=CAMNT_0049616907 /DNA_START=925 /DNA_END=1371 /DNA_ORIENTATION=+